MTENQTGFCQCGCGEKTNLAPTTRKNIGWVKGEPLRFINWHCLRGRMGVDAVRWKGGRTTDGKYIRVLVPGHPRGDRQGYVHEHILIAEKALGKPLPPGAIVHHVNGNGADNRPENLVICQDQSYHKTLHRRQRAYEVCGHASWRKCHICKKYDDPRNLFVSKIPNQAPYHRSCSAMKMRERRLGWGGRTAPRRFVVASP